MSDYVKATNFASKDSLPSGNSGKIIKGTEIDTEYNAIASAIASKADINSPTFTGTPAAPTATSTTNTTQIATTAFVQTIKTSILDSIYPVGSIYVNATSSTNPGTLLGFGTWTAFGAGRVMVGLDAGDTAFDVAEETGGSKDAVVVSHTHTATSTVTDPGHTHTVPISTISDSGNGEPPRMYNSGTTTTSSATTGITVATSISSTGSSATNANLQPYIVVRMWKRVS